MATKQKSVYRIVIHDEYPIFECSGAKRLPTTSQSMLFDFYSVSDVIGEVKASAMMEEIAASCPTLYKYWNEHWGIEEWFGTMYVTHGTQEDHRQILDDYAKYFIPIVYQSGGDDTHYDYIPSAVEEFLYYCNAVEYYEPAQALYDSLWAGPPTHIREHPEMYEWALENSQERLYLWDWKKESSYYPLSDDSDDPGLYRYFNDLIKSGAIKANEYHPTD